MSKRIEASLRVVKYGQDEKGGRREFPSPAFFVLGHLAICCRPSRSMLQLFCQLLDNDS